MTATNYFLNTLAQDQYFNIYPREFFRRSNKNEIDCFETERIVIAQLFS